MGINFLRKIIFFFSILAGSFSQAWALETLTWTDCLREAARNHPDLIAAKEGIEQSQADKKIAVGGVWPELTADLNAATIQTSDTGSAKAFSYGLSGSMLLFDGLKTPHNILAASADIKAAKENFKFTSASLRFILRQAFVDLLKAQKLVDLTQEIYNLRKSNLELITLRYESGTEHRGALLTAKANMSEAVFEINASKRGLETAQRKLSKELGRNTFGPLIVQDDFDMTSDITISPDFEKIAQNNPSVLKISAQRNAAAYDIKARQGDFLPTVVLNAGADKPDNRWPPRKDETSAGVKVSLPLFSGGANAARLSKSRSVYRQLEQEERSIQDGVAFNLEKNWNDLADAYEKVTVQKDFLAAAEERAKIAQAQYSVGIITFDNWTIIEDDLVDNRKTFLDVQAQALLAEANWIQAKGETLEYEK